jgi:hypothetical protein
MTFSKTTLSLKGLFAKLSKSGTQSNNTLYRVPLCCSYAECPGSYLVILNVVLLSVVMNVIMLNVVMNVIMLSVEAHLLLS